ncbi:MAG TPA: hypothetical protein VM409_03665 [Chloroflexia bacterium]|nr:hypothetical protein [Chloroflexia bacterium]
MTVHRTERVFVLAVVLFVGLGLTLAVSRGVFSQGGVLAPLIWLLAAMLMLVAAAGAYWLRSGLRTAPATTLPHAFLPLIKLPSDVLIPGTLVAGFTIFLQLFDSALIQTLVLALAGASFAAVYWAQAHAVDWEDRYFGLAQLALNIASHLTAFLFFSVIYGLKVRALYSATAVGIVASLLVYEMLSRDAIWHRAMNMPVQGKRSTLALLSVSCGLVAGEITWGLNYWAALSTLVGGAFLLLVFYVIYGLVSHYVNDSFSRAILVEFAAVGVIGVLVIFLSAFYS